MSDVEKTDPETARNRFLAACSLAGAATTAYRAPLGDGQTTAAWLDVARLGLPDARSVLILCCGLNGEEGHCGSTIMTHLLSQGYFQTVPRSIGMVFIHTVLPSGMAAGGATAPDDIGSRDWSDNVLSAAARRFARYARLKGIADRSQADDEDAKDANLVWLAEAFDAVAREVAEHAGHVGLVEFHTSMQPLGNHHVTSTHAPGGAADRRVMDWFGEQSGARESGPASLDCFALGLADPLRSVPLTAVHADFGVYTTRALLGLEARQSTAERRADIGGLFFPTTASWLAGLRETGRDIVSRALRGLEKSQR